MGMLATVMNALVAMRWAGQHSDRRDVLNSMVVVEHYDRGL